MDSSAAKINQFIRALFYSLFFLTPLILWPFTSEVFEFNKMMFVYLVTILIASAWLGKSLITHRFEFRRTPLDVPIILFLASQLISTFTSIDPHTSLLGYYSRFHGGLASTISYIILYYAFVTHFSGQIKSLTKIITTILISAAVVSVYAILEHFGIDKDIWVQDVQNRVFSTLGQPNWLSAYLAAVLPLSLFQITSSTNLKHKLTHLALSLLYLTAIIFTKSQSGIGATAVILLLFYLLTCFRSKKIWLISALVPLVAGLLIFKGDSIQRTLGSLNKINPFYSDTLTIITEENKTRIGGSDSMAIRRVVWEGALKLGIQRPLFGTGVETFGYSYYWVRPKAHNLTSEADFLYNKAHNEYLNFLATTGFFGLLTYLFLIFSIIRLFLTSAHQDHRLALLLGFLSILITNYFGFSVVCIGLFFFLFPAIQTSLEPSKTQAVSRRFPLGSTFGFLLVFGITAYLLISLTNIWRADLAYNKGKFSLEETQKAIDLNPHEPIYYAQLGNLTALVSAQYIAPEIAKLPATASAGIRQQAQEYLNQYLNTALTNAQKAHDLNPYNLNTLKLKAKTELVLASIDPKYYQNALTTLIKITELSPSESNNYLNLGILYRTLGNQDLSQIAFRRALELNPSSLAAQEYLKQPQMIK